MGLKEKIQGKRVYVDTNILIYLFEGFQAYRHLIQEIADSIDNGDVVLFTGEITVAEIMVMPFKVNDTSLIHFYTKALNDINFINLIPTTQDIYVKTAYLRASFPKMKTPDSIHVASAIAAKMDIFITNDAGICTPKMIDKILLSDFL